MNLQKTGGWINENGLQLCSMDRPAYVVGIRQVANTSERDRHYTLDEDERIPPEVIPSLRVSNRGFSKHDVRIRKDEPIVDGI